MTFNIDFKHMTFAELLDAYEHYKSLADRNRQRYNQYKDSAYAESALSDVESADELVKACWAELEKRQN